MDSSPFSEGRGYAAVFTLWVPLRHAKRETSIMSVNSFGELMLNIVFCVGRDGTNGRYY